MLVEIFKGTPKKLKERLDILIAGARTINQVIKVHGGEFIIIHS